MDENIKEMIQEYMKEYKKGNFNKANIIAEKLDEEYNVNTTFSIDTIRFTDWQTNKVLYHFEL